MKENWGRQCRDQKERAVVKTIDTVLVLAKMQDIALAFRDIINTKDSWKVLHLTRLYLRKERKSGENND